jgi:o-succinylbenzoate synthase
MGDQEDIRLSQELVWRIVPYELFFKKPAKTSRDVLVSKELWFLVCTDDAGVSGIGECAPIFGLSRESREQTIAFLKNTFQEHFITPSQPWPSAVRTAWEAALADYRSGGKREPFQFSFHPIRINGLVWMNDKEGMLKEAHEKISSGFRCLKLKIGGIDFAEELDILKDIRNTWSPERLEIRLDANGAFHPSEALHKLQQLSVFDIHSIEQPIRAGNWEAMAGVVSTSPIPVALDEELIGVDEATQGDLLDAINPHYIILKPTLHGGFQACEKWINAAQQRHIQWWATSALESSIGLNAIARWVQRYDLALPQGLGTGSLYTNNVLSPLETKGEFLTYIQEREWDLSVIFPSQTKTT